MIASNAAATSPSRFWLYSREASASARFSLGVLCSIPMPLPRLSEQISALTTCSAKPRSPSTGRQPCAPSAPGRSFAWNSPTEMHTLWPGVNSPFGVRKMSRGGFCGKSSGAISWKTYSPPAYGSLSPTTRKYTTRRSRELGVASK